MINCGPVIDTIVHNKRYGSNELIARTKDFVFVYNVNLKKVSDYRAIHKQNNNIWPLRDYLKFLINWPQCDKEKFKDDIAVLNVHVHAFYDKLCKS